MIRILNLFTILNRGGAETMVMNYYRQMDRTKVQFDFLVHRQEEGAYEAEILSLGGRIFRLPALTLRNLPKYIRAVRQFFDAHPEYRHIHGHCSELGYFIYKEASKRGLPFIAAHAHNTPTRGDATTPVRNLLKRLMRPYLTHTLGCSIPASNWLFGEKLCSNTFILNNAVDSRQYLFSEQVRVASRSSLGVSDELLLGNVSRLCVQKNHRFLIEVFHEFIKISPNSKLLLVGTGDLDAELKELVERLGISSKVIFLGSRTDIPQLLMAMDVFFFPSLYEGLSVAMVEAQAAGLNIVTSTGVTQDIALVPDAVRFLSLEAPIAEWVEALVEAAKPHDWVSYNDAVIRSGFDVKENALKLQDYYLSATPNDH